jgi:hypothetical protein
MYKKLYKIILAKYSVVYIIKNREKYTGEAPPKLQFLGKP